MGSPGFKPDQLKYHLKSLLK